MEYFNTDIERECLKAIIMQENSRAFAFANIYPEDFFDIKNREIFTRIREIFIDGKELIICDLIEGDIQGSYINSLVEHPRSSIQTICTSMQNLAYIRKYRTATKEVESIIDNGSKLKSSEVISEIERVFLKTLEKRHDGKTLKYSKAITAGLEKMNRAIEGKTGIKTGFKSLDKILIGIESDNLVILAARPSMGKTAFVSSIISNNAKLGIPVFYVSIEMSAAQLSLREMSSESGVSYTRIRNGWVTEDEVSRVVLAGNALEKLPIHIDESSDMSIEKLYAKCRMMKQRHDIGLIVIDHIGLMDVDGKTFGAYEKMNQISCGIKRIAKTLKVPVIALHQLSRKNEDRTDKMPRMSDLRDSGNIEQDADIVILLHRDEYYNENSTKKGVMDVIVAKGRDSGMGRTELLFRPEFMKYVDISPHSDNF